MDNRSVCGRKQLNNPGICCGLQFRWREMHACRRRYHGKSAVLRRCMHAASATLAATAAIALAASAASAAITTTDTPESSIYTAQPVKQLLSSSSVELPATVGGSRITGSEHGDERCFSERGWRKSRMWSIPYLNWWHIPLRAGLWSNMERDPRCMRGAWCTAVYRT